MANRYSAEIKFKLSPADARKKAVAILDLFGWKLGKSDSATIKARTGFSAFGFGEYFRVTVLESKRMLIMSETIYPFHFFDSGKNQSNVEKFIDAFRNPKLPFEDKHRSFFDRFLSAR